MGSGMKTPTVGIFDSKQYTPEQLLVYKDIKLKATRLFKELEMLKPSREKSLAITKLEECIMWSNKSLSREE